MLGLGSERFCIDFAFRVSGMSGFYGVVVSGRVLLRLEESTLGFSAKFLSMYLLSLLLSSPDGTTLFLDSS